MTTKKADKRLEEMLMILALCIAAASAYALILSTLAEYLHYYDQRQHDKLTFYDSVLEAAYIRLYSITT